MPQVELSVREYEIICQLRDSVSLTSAPMTKEMVENMKAKPRPNAVPLGELGSWKKVSEVEKNQIVAAPISMRSSVLNEANKIVNGERAGTYGGPEDAFKTVADLWNAYFNQSSKGIPSIKAHDVAILLALLKVARLKATPTHRDSWVDLAGYAACGAECGLK